MGSRNFVLGLVASVLTVAAAVGLLLLVQSSDGSDLVLPDRLGDLEAVTDSDAVTDGLAYNSERWAEAFDGADTDTGLYADPDRTRVEQVVVTAVAADAGPLLPEQGFTDGEAQGFALPVVERTVADDVPCLLFRIAPPRLGTDYQPDQAAPTTVLCQRSSGSLSVRVRSVGGDEQSVRDQLGEVWDELD